MKKIVVSLALALSLGACSTYQPVPEGYAGPTARVRDSGFSEDLTKAQMFAMTEVEGNHISNAFSASAQRSSGQGAMLTTVFPERAVPVRPMKVTLRASHATGAPIHAIASKMKGTFFEAAGVVDFSPQAGASYVVKGQLKADGSSVWIEDAATGKPVTAVISK